jgi:hypothetical protein
MSSSSENFSSEVRLRCERQAGVSRHGATSSESIVGHGSTVRREAPLDRSAMSEMDGSRGQRVLSAPVRVGGWSEDGLETASLVVGMDFNTALNP